MYVDYFGRSTKSDLEAKPRIKMCLTGCCGVGKSVFYHNYFGTMNQFKNVSTSAADISCKKVKIDGKGESTVSIWDTAGQEKYSSITNIFYKDCQGVLIIFDITNKESFDQIENHWIPQLKKIVNLDEISVCFVGNKIDLEESRAVDKEQGEILAFKHGFVYREISALMNEGVDDCVSALTEKIVLRME